MAATEHKEHKGGIFLRLTMVLGVLALCSVALRAEDLTTLNGKTYTNITDVSKYPTMVVFTYNNERTSAAISNLPPEFRTNHGIVIKTNTPKVSVAAAQQNPVDLFLWQNRESQIHQLEGRLYQIECNYFTTNKFIEKISKQCCIHLSQGVEVSLSAQTDTTIGNNVHKDSQNMEFEVGQEELVSKVFDKFIEWEAIAATNHTENFQKEFAKRPMNRSASDYAKEIYKGFCVYTFSWNDGEAELRVEDTAPYSGYFDKEDVIHFQALLKLLPSMKEKLVSAIRSKESQKDLFK